MNKEIEHLYTYYNPLNLQQKTIPNIKEYMLSTKYQSITDKQWKNYSNVMFQIDPLLALQVSHRIKNKAMKSIV